MTNSNNKKKWKSDNYYFTFSHSSVIAFSNIKATSISNHQTHFQASHVAQNDIFQSFIFPQCAARFVPLIGQFFFSSFLSKSNIIFNDTMHRGWIHDVRGENCIKTYNVFYIVAAHGFACSTNALRGKLCNAFVGCFHCFYALRSFFLSCYV